MIDRKDFLDQPVKRDMRTYDNVQKIATGQGDDSTTGCILDYNYFYNYFTWYQLIQGNNKHLMLIQKQYNNLILLKI